MVNSGGEAMAGARDRPAAEGDIWAILAQVADPEIPVISIVDLGIVRHVTVDERGVEVGLSPTYSGCPATDLIRSLVVESLAAHGLGARIRMVLNPPWTTDWISAAGREKLRRYGIVPPRLVAGAAGGAVVANEEIPGCPHCGSAHTERVSEFGSTPCKSLYRCRDCLEPFERFKCL
jgi:ring-1,2-phenylacetyl-CoA epoxidase subunit PaaD